MIDETPKDDMPRPRGGGKRRREPRTIDLAAAEIVEETAPLAGRSGVPETAARPDAPADAEAPSAPDADVAAATSVDPGVEPPAAPADEPAAGVELPARDEKMDEEKMAAAPPFPPPPVRQGAGIGGLALAGLLGGVAGAVLALIIPALFPTVDESGARITALERGVEQQIGAVAKRTDAEALGRRITSVEDGLKRVGSDIAAVSGKADDSAQRLAALPPPQPAGAVVDDGRLAALAARLAPLEAAVKAIDPNAARSAEALAKVASLEGRLAALEKTAANPRVDVLARAILAGDLMRAVEDGRPYGAELAALRNTGLAAPALAALDSRAAAGVPTLAVLLRDFAPLTGAIIAESTPAAEGGILDRLGASASRLVSIRPVEGTGGTSPAAIVARIETALRRGDAGEAQKLWQSLPAPGRAASQAWGDRLAGRVAAESTARAIAADTTAALATKKEGIAPR